MPGREKGEPLEMSVPSRAPLRMAGAVVNALFPNTGEVRFTRGGDQTFWSQSGVAVDTQVFSGAGRLNTITRLTQASGAGVYFYDGIIATSGGPFAASGHKVIGAIIQPIPLPLTGSGTNNVFQWQGVGVPLAVDMPFSSGLIMAPIGSGTPSFNFSWTPETNPGASGLAT